MTKAQFHAKRLFGGGWKNNLKGVRAGLFPELPGPVATGLTKTVLDR